MALTRTRRKAGVLGDADTAPPTTCLMGLPAMQELRDAWHGFDFPSPSRPWALRRPFMRHLLLTLLLAGGVAGPIQAQSQDSSATSSDTTATGADWLIVPYVSYTPSTKIALGGAVGYYRTAPPGRSPSQVELSLNVTQRRQISAEIAPQLYLNAEQLRIKGKLRGSKYPGSFHGIGGDTPETAKESYTSRHGVLDFILQRRIRPNLHVGPRVFVRVGAITDSEANGLIENNRVMGADGGTTVGLGGAILRDTRDNRYFPTTGTYAEAVVTWYSSAWGSDYTFGYLETDLRNYRSMGPGVLAGQIYTSSVVGRAPFLLLPQLGGADQMRGYRSGRFRDNVLWSAQIEYRFPLFWRFKGAAFTSAGEVGPRMGTALFEEVGVAAGLGGRLRLTDSGLHGRLDVAYSRTGIEFYLAVGEAF